jgi:hypothetical protein
VLNEAQRDEDESRNGGVSPHILKLGTELPELIGRAVNSLVSKVLSFLCVTTNAGFGGFLADRLKRSVNVPFELHKVHYHVHKSLPPVPVLSHVHAVHTFPTFSPKIHTNFIFPSTPRSSEWSLPFRFSDTYIVCTSDFFHACYMSRLSPP